MQDDAEGEEVGFAVEAVGAAVTEAWVVVVVVDDDVVVEIGV